MAKQDLWHKKDIHTLVGYLDKHKFTTLNGEIYNVTSYKIIMKAHSKGIVAVNIKWHPMVESWVIFQLVEMESQEKRK
jgi:hypothetical protein